MFFTCDPCGDEMTCRNPPQTADNHSAGRKGNLELQCAQEGSKKNVSAEECASQEQPRKRAHQGTSRALGKQPHGGC
jgi:hypothetical protein